MRKAKSVVTMLFAALVGTALATGPAYASQDIAATTVFLGRNPVGYGYFKANGDKLAACDTKADGYGVRATLKGLRTGHVCKSVFVGGAGRCVTNSSNLPEEQFVQLTVCMVDNGVQFNCKTSRRGIS
ncbi:hypothetical protein ABZ611_10555 [Streptomyces sp. NPDC007861]|uniref:hypothetical protein n=1 Tax=Streptomyces sp. NPDC007861 TaxID=3154893 RepID=UPI0033F7CE66